MLECLRVSVTCYNSPALAWILYASLVALAVLAGIYLNRYAKFVHRTTWWDPSEKGPFEKLDWPDVVTLMNEDPACYSPKERCYRFCSQRMMVLGLYALGIIWGVASFFLIHSKMNNLTVAKLGDLGTFFVGISVVIGVAGFLIRTRIDTRSRNRQEWIDQIRGCLSGLFFHMPEAWRYADRKDDLGLFVLKPIEDAQAYYLEHHGELELLLNPSECEHRALLSLLRYMYLLDMIGIDEVAYKELDLNQYCRFDKYKWIDLKSKAVRLSNAVLKREWEQIKHVR
ncbi:hypothetical protein RJ527_01590 [Thalassospiraceae bacterium LMO-SO8]|nr:hypothetical protein [Alphaproteobacteria bacterium LMO-S08]WND76450.1 hypothetical protein RJ527_01590 [Thalassospiraceae bacterium LMO-SO8]